MKPATYTQIKNYIREKRKVTDKNLVFDLSWHIHGFVVRGHTDMGWSDVFEQPDDVLLLIKLLQREVKRRGINEAN